MASRLRFRVTAPADKTNSLINELLGSPMIRRAEEVDDLTSGMRDDSSSAQLPDDQGPGSHQVEIEFRDEFEEERVRDLVALKSGSRGMALEFLEPM